MKAPDKIYVHVKKGKTLNIWNSEWIGVNDIEYTRTDAFIEKAADYIKKDMLDNFAFQGRLNRIKIIDGIIDKFIKTMKGEQSYEKTI